METPTPFAVLSLVLWGTGHIDPQLSALSVKWRQEHLRDTAGLVKARDSHRLLSHCHLGNHLGTVGGRSLATAISFFCITVITCDMQWRCGGCEGKGMTQTCN